MNGSGTSRARSCWRSYALMLLYSLLVSCGSLRVSEPGGEATQRSRVERLLGQFGSGLRAGQWSAVEDLFSRDYQGGYAEFRDRKEAKMRTERILSIEFVPGAILESGQLINVRARWNKTSLNPSGKPQPSSGTTELILRPEEGGLRILRMSGDLPF